jgi:hypothetical protein
MSDTFRNQIVTWRSNLANPAKIEPLMDYQPSENQETKLQIQVNQAKQVITSLVDRLKTKIMGPYYMREFLPDLREDTLAVSKQNQMNQVLIVRMVKYIHTLQNYVSVMPQTP